MELFVVSKDPSLLEDFRTVNDSEIHVTREQEFADISICRPIAGVFFERQGAVEREVDHSSASACLQNHPSVRPKLDAAW